MKILISSLSPWRWHKMPSYLDILHPALLFFWIVSSPGFPLSFQHCHQMPPELAEPLLCTTFTLTYFFHLASFYWMFCEGFYLFLQVTSLSLPKTLFSRSSSPYPWCRSSTSTSCSSAWPPPSPTRLSGWQYASQRRDKTIRTIRLIWWKMPIVIF